VAGFKNNAGCLDFRGELCDTHERIELHSGCSVDIYSATGKVRYIYSSFDGTFVTKQTLYSKCCRNNWTANIWGC
jgi:hypothetical protein